MMTIWREQNSFLIYLQQFVQAVFSHSIIITIEKNN